MLEVLIWPTIAMLSLLWLGVTVLIWLRPNKGF